LEIGSSTRWKLYANWKLVQLGEQDPQFIPGFESDQLLMTDKLGSGISNIALTECLF
jgi:hypothetical protein